MSKFSKIFKDIKSKELNNNPNGEKGGFPLGNELSIIDNENKEFDVGEDIMRMKRSPFITGNIQNDDDDDCTEETILEDCDLPALISTKKELIELNKIFPNSRYLQTIKDSIENSKDIRELEIPYLNNDDEAKLFYRNISTTNTKIIDGSTTVNLNKVEGHDFTGSLDILDTSNELSISSWYGRLFSLLAVTTTPIYHFNICTLTIMYGRDFFNACIIMSFFFCMPLMYLEILIGQFTAINISSFYSKMSPAWNMVRTMFVLIFYIYGVYSLIYCIYFMTEALLIENIYTKSELATTNCPDDSPESCMNNVLSYYCLYGERSNKYFKECEVFYEALEKSFYRQDNDKLRSSRYLEKSKYTFAIIPTNDYSVLTYSGCFVVWLLITLFKRNGYAKNSGILLSFYVGYIFSLFGILYTLALKDASFTDALYFLAPQSKNIFEIDIEVWILAGTSMFLTFKSGHGVIMKISSFFPSNTSNTSLAFFVTVINTFIMTIQVFIWLCLYRLAIGQDMKDVTWSSMTMSKKDTKIYLSSSLILYAQTSFMYEKSLSFLLNLFMFGLTAYQAFVYIDLMDCEIHNVGIKHNRYLATRYKTTAAMTFLFLLIPIFSITYPIIGEIFLIFEETLTLKMGINLWQLMLIFYGLGYNKIRFSCAVKVHKHVIRFLIGKYCQFILIPILSFIFTISIILKEGKLTGWTLFIRETSDESLNLFVHMVIMANSSFCLLIWPLLQMLRTIFYGKRPTSIFKCQLPHTKQ